jgi:hypothetical protein
VPTRTLRIVLRRLGDHAPVRKHGQARAARRIDADDDVAVTGKVFRERRVVETPADAPPLRMTTGYDGCCGDTAALCVL